MKEKKFYTMCKKGSLKGAVRQDGFEAERDGLKVYIYRALPDFISIIDPETGLSLFTERCEGRITEAEELIFTHSNMEKIREMRKIEAYPLLCETFKKYREAAVLDEKNRSIVDKINRM